MRTDTGEIVTTRKAKDDEMQSAFQETPLSPGRLSEKVTDEAI
jgi:hypothetical protein